MIAGRRLLTVAAMAAVITVIAIRAARPRAASGAATSSTSSGVIASQVPTLAPAPNAADGVAHPRGLGVAAIEGVAERQRGVERHRLAVGDVIERSDWVSTGRSTSLRLDGAGGTSIEVASSTRVRLDETEGSRARLTLDRGRLRATSRPLGTVAVRAADGSAAVEGADADFTVQAESGVVRVVPHRNRVTLIARDERVDIAPGVGAVVAGGNPAVLAKLPRSLLLKVRWPEATAQRDTHLRVEGETAPGATVRAGPGAEVIADAQGRFAITVPLRDGENHPRLTSEDLAGRRVASTGQPVLVDRSRPEIEPGGVRYE